MFDVSFSVADKYDGGYKKTICRIYRVYDEFHRDLIAAATAYWNYTVDYYDLEIGKKTALERAYNNMSNSAKCEFDDWFESL